MSTQTFSRRRFLKAAGLTVGASVAACSGLTYAATRAPLIDTPDFTVGGESSTNPRVLVAYATRAGSTVEIATAVGETLAARGYAVDVKPVNDKPSVEGYQAVVIGSAIRIGRWLPEAIEFVTHNQQALNRLPVALFTVHILNVEDDAQSRANREAYLSDVRPLLNPVSEMYFPGRIDLARLSFLERQLAKVVHSPIGDFRDWEQIHGWAQVILADNLERTS